MNNREIRFRIWVKSEKKMYNWFGNEDIILDAIQYECGDEWTEDCELMQYTGFKDQNSKEIYEGDIITNHAKSEFIPKIAEVKCCHGAYIADCGSALLSMSFTQRMIEGTVEIIGNIFETPNLLKKIDKIQQV